MQKITPYLWFENNNAQEAAEYYTTVFKNAKVTNSIPGGQDGTPMVVMFEIEGMQFIGLNGGKHDAFNQAISLYVHCNTQEEVDELYDTLADDGEESKCGWVIDKFGISWQIIPETLSRLLGDPDQEKAGRALEAMLQMNKIIIKDLQDAYDGKSK